MIGAGHVFKFSADLKRFQEKVRVSAPTALKAVAFAVHDEVVARTPIDTGRAKASWNIRDGGADLSVEPNLDATPITAEQAAGIAKRKQEAVTGAAKQIVISNNLDYIVDLENGKSSQAPAGMAALATNAIENAIAFSNTNP